MASGSLAHRFMDTLRAIGLVEWFRHSRGPDLGHLDTPLFVWRYAAESPDAVDRLAAALTSFGGTVAWEWDRQQRGSGLGGSNWWLTLREVGQIQTERKFTTDSQAMAA